MSTINIDLNLRGEKPTAHGLRNVGDAADKAGDGLKDMAKDAGFLDKRMVELRGSLKKSIEEFDKTGDLDLLKKINVGKRELGKFARIKKTLSDLASDASDEGGKAGTAFGGSLLKSAATALMGSKALLIGSVAALAVAALPFLGASVAAAVLGGAGTGGIIGGLALAATDSRVSGAAAELGNRALAEFSHAAEPFIAPAVAAIDILKGTVSTAAGSMRQAFATIAPVLLPLVKGIDALVQEAMPGFTKAMEAAKPVIRALANELPGIGEAISDFFEAVTEDPDGAIMAMTLLMKIVQTLIRGTGQFIAILGNAFEWTVRVASKIAPVMEAMFGWIPILGNHLSTQRKRVDELLVSQDKAKDGSGDFAGSLKDVAAAAGDAEGEIAALNDVMDRFFGRTMDLHQATKNYEKAIDDLVDAVKENGKTLDIGTEKGRANQGAILDQIQAIKNLRDAHLDNGMSVDRANGIYDKQLEQLRATAIKLGLNRDEVNKLIEAYKKLPAEAAVEIKAPGLLAAIERVKELRRLLGSMTGAVNFGNPNAPGRAVGGPVYPGQTYVVGEHGPEVLQMGSTSGRVFSNAQSQSMMATSAAPQVIEFRFPTGANGLERMFLSWFQGAVRANPGFRLVTA